MDYVGGFSERCFKLLALTVWGVHTVDYLRRKGNRIEVKTRTVAQRFRVANRQIISDFRALESMGYVYNVTVTVGRVSFNLNLPKWLQPTEASKALEDDNITQGVKLQPPKETWD